jgi:hypothetical protein
LRVLRAVVFRVPELVLLARVEPELLDFAAAVPFAALFVRAEVVRFVVLADAFAALLSALARVTVDFVASLTALPAALAADLTPFAAALPADFASFAAARASLDCRVDAAFLPAADDVVLC